MLGFAAVPTIEVYAGVRPVLSNWLPFLFYAIFAAAIPATLENQPLGYGQHWECLRNVQANHGDVLLTTEFLKMIGA